MAKQTPIPQNPIGENFVWRDWFQRLSDKVFGSAAAIDVPIQPEYGGTGITTYNKGDIIYSNATNNLTRLAAPASTSVLQMTALGVPSWTTASTGTVTSVGGTGTVNGLTLTGTVTSSGNLTLGGTLDLSSPPAIGGTTPAAGTFTTLTANGIGGATGFTLGRDTASSVNSARFFLDSSGGAISMLNAGGNTFGFATAATIGAATGSTQMRVSHTASAVNYVQVTGAATSVFPAITAQGSDANIGLTLASKGTQAVRFNTNGTDQQFRVSNTSGSDSYIEVKGGSSATGGAYITAAGTSRNLYISSGAANPIRFFTGGEGSLEQLRVSNTASAVNYVQVTGAATGGRPTFSSQGSDTNIALGFDSKGTGAHIFRTNGLIQSQIVNTASAVNYTTQTGAAAGASPVFSVAGTDTNIDLTLTPKGTGNVRFGTYTVSAGLVTTGYIEIKDASGTIRRLAVV